VNIISSVLVPVLGFLKVRLFIDLYGSEINGLQLFFAQIIMYLNIFELSFSLAFRQLLFKPLAEKNYDEIKSIYKGAKKIFNVTGTLLLSCGLIISLILPWISETTFDYGTTVLYFLILCLPYGLSYYLMGPNFVIIADQKEYKISIWIQSFVFLRSILMIVAIALKLPVIVVFIIESMQVFLSNYVARKIAVKNYPWLLDLKDVKEDKRFFQNAKYTAVHRLATIANNNTDNIVITAFLNLTSVSIYGAYSYLSEAVIKIINSIVTAPMNSFGNLYSEKNSNAYNIFLEFFNLSNYLASIISICLFVIMNDFVYLWTGKEEYILPIIASVLFAMNMYYLTQRECIITTRDANGLF
jgi:O-antigen/teichoic acid export membrane protein